MTKQADFKRVRARMAKTGESYAAARSQLLAAVPGGGRPTAARQQRRLNGVYRWIGGVRLTGRNIRWRWDEGREAITATR